MAEFIDQMRGIIENVILGLGYPGITLAMLLENLFPPIPSELVMPFSGFLVARGRLTFVGILASGTLGAVLGASLIYFLSMKIGADRFRTGIERYGRYLLLDVRDFDRAMDVFQQHGHLMILFGRLIPAFRSLISIPAGIQRMNFPLFLLYTSMGSLAWNLLLGGLGVIMRSNWVQILEWIKTYELILSGLLAVLVSLFVVKRLRRLRAG